MSAAKCPFQVVEGEASHEALTTARERLESLSLSHRNVARMLAVGTRHMPAVTHTRWQL